MKCQYQRTLISFNNSKYYYLMSIYRSEHTRRKSKKTTKNKLNCTKTKEEFEKSLLNDDEI